MNEVAFDQEFACVKLIGVGCPEENQNKVKVENHLPISVILTIVIWKCFRRVSLDLIGQSQEIFGVFMVKVLRCQKQRAKVN